MGRAKRYPSPLPMKRWVSLPSTHPTAYGQSRSDQKFGALDDVRRMAEVADVSDLVGLPVQQHEIFRARAGRIGIEHQDGRMPFHRSRHQMPIAGDRIIAKIAGDLRLALHAGL